LAGFSAALATMGALCSVMKNFTRVVAILPIGLFISYIKMGPDFTQALKALFFQDVPLQTFMFYEAGLTIVTYVLCIFLCRKIDMKPNHKKECQDSDSYGFFIYYLVLVLWVAYLYVGKYVYDAPGAGFWATLIFMALNFIAAAIAMFIQISSFDDENDALPVGDNLKFTQYLKRPKYWFLAFASFAIIGVCYAMNDYDAFTQLAGDDDGFSNKIFWVCDIGTRLFGALLAYLLARWINEYIWAIIYSAFGFCGTILIFAMTLTDEVEANQWLVWTAVVLLGIATGGWWQIGAQTVLDDSGFIEFGTKWGLIVTLNYIGMFVGGNVLAIFDMSMEAAIVFLVMGLASIVLSILALCLDYFRDPADPARRRLNKDKDKPSDE